MQTATRVLISVQKDPRLARIANRSRRILMATCKTRDEQVLRSTLRGRHYQAWLKKRSRRLHQLEREIPKALAKNISPEFTENSRVLILQSLGSLPHSQAQTQIEKECRRLKKMSRELSKNKSDSDFLHKFRIRVKRFRYALELFGSLLPKHFRRSELKSALKDLQSDFGHVHDLDYAIQLLERDRQPMIERLKNRRLEFLNSALISGKRIRKIL